MGLLGGALGLLSWLLGLFTRGPSREAKAAERAATAEVKHEVEQAAAKTSAAIAQAEVDAPKERSAVIVQLNKGRF